MKAAIVVLSLFAVAACAPVGEKADNLDITGDDMRVKRAKETMMFGNQQNQDQQNDKTKRTDPSDNVDEKGYIIAKEAKDLETEDEGDANTSEETVNGNEEAADETADESATETEMVEEQDQDMESNEQDVSETQETEEALQDNNALEPVGATWEDYLKELGQIKVEDDSVTPYFNNLLKDTRDSFWNQDAYRYLNNYNSPYNNYLRTRRSQVRAMKNLRFPILKRAHRAKRQAYYIPDLPYGYEDVPLEEQYNNYRMTEEDLAELLDLLASTYDDGGYEGGYAPYYEPNELEFESPIYAPKRQAGLTFVPGIKRNPDFFPYADEPYTHYGAFIPDKRSLRDEADAYDAYERVMELAAALRQQGYYPEVYRRRK